ncbi:MAG: hypothetical protein ACTSSJ_07150 [Candidatus Odinarchaeia archaeon]
MSELIERMDKYLIGLINLVSQSVLGEKNAEIEIESIKGIDSFEKTLENLLSIFDRTDKVLKLLQELNAGSSKIINNIRRYLIPLKLALKRASDKRIIRVSYGFSTGGLEESLLILQRNRQILDNLRQRENLNTLNKLSTLIKGDMGILEERINTLEETILRLKRSLKQIFEPLMLR